MMFYSSSVSRVQPEEGDSSSLHWCVGAEKTCSFFSTCKQKQDQMGAKLASSVALNSTALLMWSNLLLYLCKLEKKRFAFVVGL